MNDKYAKEVVRELRLIRVELQKMNKPVGSIGIKINDLTDGVVNNIEKEKRAKQILAGERG